jgi:PAS domain-containing protein
MMDAYFAGLAERLPKEIVICDLNHTILYLNQTAREQYEPRFGTDMVGKNLLDCHNPRSCSIIKEQLAYVLEHGLDSVLLTDRPDKKKKSYLTLIKNENGEAIGYYERYEGDAF